MLLPFAFPEVSSPESVPSPAHTTVDGMTRSHSEWAFQRLLKEMSEVVRLYKRFSCATFLDAQGNLKVWFWIQCFDVALSLKKTTCQNISFEGLYRADKEDKATEKL
ncbi:unnamed protein product [Brassica oleracea var. botrytis]|uniref:Uncharacterized protein n=2 Tax=Brassica TaxID=3705 RepID=A0A3P6CDW9_BRAOL|nr:unnamed protein product [Brassica napus]VDD08755.1 unnamed protein product [Brassica oleracea]